MRVLVTGASGFVGRHLCRSLVAAKYDVVAAVRGEFQMAGVHTVVVDDLGPKTNWDEALQGVDMVVHLAARVHVLNDIETDPLSTYRRVNTLGSERLARCAAKIGVARFIYVSTIKVLGEETKDRPFRPDDVPAPIDPYAISKWEAEQALCDISSSSGMELVVLRPPLIYGPGVGANVRRALSLVSKSIPLPIGKIENKRSMLAVSNFCQLIGLCLCDPIAVGRTLLVSDDSDLSTSEFFSLISRLMGKRSRILNVPLFVLRTFARAMGRSPDIDRICVSLQVDVEETKQLLGWIPMVSPEEEMRATVEWYRNQLKTGE